MTQNYLWIFFPPHILGYRLVPQMWIPFVDAINVSLAGYFDVTFGQQKLTNRLLWDLCLNRITLMIISKCIVYIYLENLLDLTWNHWLRSLCLVPTPSLLRCHKAHNQRLPCSFLVEKHFLHLSHCYHWFFCKLYNVLFIVNMIL